MPRPSLSRRTLLRSGVAGAFALAAPPALAGCTQPAAPSTPATVTFPPGFGWGAATSAYQVEGAAATDGRGPSIWDTFARVPGNVRGGDTGDVACDHYHRYADDVALMADLGLRSYRFSVSWSRVLPAGTGPVNPKGLDFYKRLVDALHKAGIAPMLTLFHWDLPQALQDRGGWLNRDCADWFADYATVVATALGASVPTFLTLNEPKTVVNVGYRFGAHAPGVRNDADAYVAAHHLLLAHGRAVAAVRAAAPKVRIGPALNLAPAYPVDPNDAGDQAAARLADGYENRLYLDPVLKGSYPADVLDDLGPTAPMRRAIRPGDLEVISAPVDLLAIQYYNPVFVETGGTYVTMLPTSDASWQQIHPDGLYDILTRVSRDYGNPLITITENGRPSADTVSPTGTVDDPARIEFLRDHFRAAHRAIEAGVRLESYHVWSLLDNFEWAEGYHQRWGIVHVDFDTQVRTRKASAEWYRSVIAANAL